MSKPFLILGPQGEEYELTDPAFFVSEYKPRGFVIHAKQPTGYAAPVLPDDAAVVAVEPDQAPELDLEKMTREQLDTYAESLGIESPDKLPNKPAVIEAIQAKTASDGTEGNDDANGDGTPGEDAS